MSDPLFEKFRKIVAKLEKDFRRRPPSEADEDEKLEELGTLAGKKLHALVERETRRVSKELAALLSSGSKEYRKALKAWHLRVGNLSARAQKEANNLVGRLEGDVEVEEPRESSGRDWAPFMVACKRVKILEGTLSRHLQEVDNKPGVVDGKEVTLVYLPHVRKVKANLKGKRGPAARNQPDSIPSRLHG